MNLKNQILTDYTGGSASLESTPEKDHDNDDNDASSSSSESNSSNSDSTEDEDSDDAQTANVQVSDVLYIFNNVSN